MAFSANNRNRLQAGIRHPAGVAPFVRRDAGAGASDPDREIFRRFVEESSLGIIIFSPESQPLFANQAYAELFGYESADELLALPSIEALIAPEHRARMRSYRRARVRGAPAPTRYDFEAVRKDQTTFLAEAIVGRCDWNGVPALSTTISDVTAERHDTRSEARRRARLMRQQTALLDLSRRRPALDKGLPEIAAVACRIAADTLDCERAEVWLFDEQREALERAAHFSRSTGDRRGETLLPKTSFPAFFQALENERVIAAHDAPTDPRKRELSAEFLARDGVSSTLDGSIRVGGVTLGTLSCEHVGEARVWRIDEQNFVASVADWISLNLELLQHHLSEQRVQLSEARYRSLFDASPIALWEEDWSRLRALAFSTYQPGRQRDPSGADDRSQSSLCAAVRVVDVNEAAVALLRLPGKSQATHWLRELPRRQLGARFRERVAAFVQGVGRRVEVLTLQRPDGERIEVRLTIEIPERHRDDWQRVYLALEDITAQEALSRELKWQASHDGLTGLANRLEFERRLDGLMLDLHSSDGQHALCYLDLDQFKLVNDTCGHAAGDQLLRELALTLADSLPQEVVLARLGGDEFAVLAPNVDVSEALEMADGLRAAVEGFRFAWLGRSFPLGVSIGLVMLDYRSAGRSQILANADAACYVAKERGGNSVQLFEADDEDLRRRYGEMEWVARIDAALREDAFTLFAQPIRKLRGPGSSASAPQSSHLEPAGLEFEILLRMNSPDGFIGPASFLPAAERYGLSERIDRWVLSQTLTLLEAVPEKFRNTIRCSINLSGQSISNSGFLPFVLERLSTSTVAAGQLCFEITESAAIANLAFATRFVETLKARGCRFALDDFGRGLSSFAYLKNLPVDALKIDGMFVKGLLNDPMNLAIVRSVNEVGHSVGMVTVAEFAESEALVEKLATMDVDYVQGFSVGEPRPLTDTLSLGMTAD